MTMNGACIVCDLLKGLKSIIREASPALSPFFLAACSALILARLCFLETRSSCALEVQTVGGIKIRNPSAAERTGKPSHPSNS